MTEDTIQLTDRSQKIKLYPYTRTSEVIDTKTDKPLEDILEKTNEVLEECKDAAESVVIISSAVSVHSDTNKNTTVTLKSSKGDDVCSFTVPDGVGTKGDKGDTGETGPAGATGPQGPAGPSYDDTAIKQRVTSLETKTTGLTRSDEGRTLVDEVDVSSLADTVSYIDTDTGHIIGDDDKTTIDGEVYFEGDVEIGVEGSDEGGNLKVYQDLSVEGAINVGQGGIVYETNNDLVSEHSAMKTKTTGITRSDDGHTLIDGVDVASKVGELEETLNEINSQPSGGGSSTPVVDNVTSTSTTSALSANQGRVLKELIDSKGTYSKPSNGVPKSDFDSSVQSSLNKADTALQSVPNTYRTSSAQDMIDSGKASKITKASSIPSGGFIPNVLYQLGSITGAVTFSLASSSLDYAEYMIEFETGATAPTITWFTGVTWFGGSAPVVSANKKYFVSVLDNLAVIGEF